MSRIKMRKIIQFISFTLLFVRGKTFGKHRLVSKALRDEFYFPKSHQLWQRGTNETTNGLLRDKNKALLSKTKELSNHLKSVPKLFYK